MDPPVKPGNDKEGVIPIPLCHSRVSGNLWIPRSSLSPWKRGPEGDK